MAGSVSRFRFISLDLQSKIYSSNFSKCHVLHQNVTSHTYLRDKTDYYIDYTWYLVSGPSAKNNFPVRIKGIKDTSHT